MLAVAWASSAQAFSTGIATTSFPVPAQACNFCHGGGLVPTVMLACVDCGGDPPVVAPLSTHEFKFTVVEIGLQNHAGLNVSSPLGTLATGGGFSANTQTLTGTGGRQEVTHTAPKAAAGGVTEFSFLWTVAGIGQCDADGLGQCRQLHRHHRGRRRRDDVADRDDQRRHADADCDRRRRPRSLPRRPRRRSAVVRRRSMPAARAASPRASSK
jgi:hypothetical protein